MSQFNYNTNPIKIDLAGIAAIRNARENKKNSEFERNKLQKEMLVQDRTNTLMEQYLLKKQIDPAYKWIDSNERRAVGGLNPDMLMKVDNHFKDLNADQKEQRKNQYFSQAYESYLALRNEDNPNRIAEQIDTLTKRRDLFKQYDPDANTEDTDTLINLLKSGKDKQALGRLADVVSIGVNTGYIDAGDPLSYKTWREYVDESTGKRKAMQSNPYGDMRSIVTGEGERAADAHARELDVKRQEIVMTQALEARDAALTKLNEDFLQYEPEMRIANELATLLDTEGVNTGLPAQIKLTISNLTGLPMDTEDEGLLESKFVDLGIRRLASSFKGPTTNFELNQSYKVGGLLGNQTDVNRAKVNGLRRGYWFLREYNKFANDYIRNSPLDAREFSDVGIKWNEKLRQKDYTWGGKKVSLLDLQGIAAKNHVTMEDIMEAMQRFNNGSP